MCYPFEGAMRCNIWGWAYVDKINLDLFKNFRGDNWLQPTFRFTKSFSMTKLKEFGEEDYLFASHTIVSLVNILCSSILAGVSNRLCTVRLY